MLTPKEAIEQCLQSKQIKIEIDNSYGLLELMVWFDNGRFYSIDLNEVPDEDGISVRDFI